MTNAFERIAMLAASATFAVIAGGAANAQSIAVSNYDGGLVQENVSIFPRTGRDFSGVIWERTRPLGPQRRAGAEPASDEAATPGRSPAQATAREAQQNAVASRLKSPFKEMYERTRAASGRFNPAVTNEPLTSDSACAPFILPGDTFYSPTFLISDDVVFIVQGQNQSNRIIYMNEKLPERIEPRWLGYSVGRWDGDSLIVESTGFNELSSIVSTGLYHTTQLRITETYTLADGGEQLLATFKLDDPGALMSPYEFSRSFSPAMNQEIYPEERVCQEASNRPTFRSDQSNEPLG